MLVNRFEGDGPVARYWLARCEGFEVEGSVRGVVEELLRDGDPHLTARLVVRTRRRRRAIVPVARVRSVVPAERVLVVEPAQKPVRPPVWRPRVRRVTAASARRSGTLARHARRRVATGTVVSARFARPWLQAGAIVLAGSFRRLAAELRASAAMLLRSRPWRRSARFGRFDSTRVVRDRSRRSSRRLTT
jgi:hypothetical protein